jgi:hypothetical protein
MWAANETRILPLRGLAPTAREFTEYDRRNFRLYAHLLVLQEDCACFEELAAVLGFDGDYNREWVERVLRSHLCRARQIFDLLWPTI